MPPRNRRPQGYLIDARLFIEADPNDTAGMSAAIATVDRVKLFLADVTHVRGIKQWFGPLPSGEELPADDPEPTARELRGALVEVEADAEEEEPRQ